MRNYNKHILQTIGVLSLANKASNYRKEKQINVAKID